MMRMARSSSALYSNNEYDINQDRMQQWWMSESRTSGDPGPKPYIGRSTFSLSSLSAPLHSCSPVSVNSMIAKASLNIEEAGGIVSEIFSYAELPQITRARTHVVLSYVQHGHLVC